MSGLVLFRTIRLYPLLSRWATLNTLAKSRLADYVECIEIANTMCTGESSGVEDWQSSTDPSWPELFEHLKSHPRHGIGSTLQDSLDIVAISPSLEACYRRTQRWRHDAQEFLDFLQAGTAPPLYLQELTKLSKVQTISDKNLGVVEYKDRTGQHRYRDRLCIETRNQQYPYISNTHLRSMMMAIKHTHITLTRLSLQSTAEICRPPFEVLNPAIHAEVQLPHLLHLTITAPSPGPPQSHWIYRDQTSWLQWGRPLPASWLSSLTQLHTFEVTENPGDESEFTVFEFLRDIHWPCLRKLRLKNVHGQVSDLQRFLVLTNVDRYGHLEELVVRNPVMAEADWVELRAELQNKLPGPVRLELTEAYKETQPLYD